MFFCCFCRRFMFFISPYKCLVFLYFYTYRSVSEAKKGQKVVKIGQKWSKLVFLRPFPKSSKKNFNFALIRPFFGGRAQPLKRRVDFWHFWIETISESVLRVPIRLLLSDAFFFGPGGPPGGPPKNGQNRVF